jgi:small-conductance mechanosensitive channel
MRSAAKATSRLGGLACVIVALIALAPPGLTQDAPDLYYEQPAINSGLPPAASGQPDRSNPRQALRGFLKATEAGDDELAAHFLNLADLDPGIQAERGPEIAYKLASVIARQVWIDWSDLPERPDAMNEAAGEAAPRAGQPRRDLAIASLQTDRSAYDIRIARYKAPGVAPVWLFTPQTLANTEPLYDSFGPRPYESLIPEGLKREVAGLWLWEWIALPLMATLLAGLGWATRYLVLLLAKRTRRDWLRTGLQRSVLPFGMLVMAGTAQLLLGWLISFSGPVHAVVRPALTVLMVWGVGMALLRLLDAVLHRVTLRYIGEIDDKRSADERDLYTSIYALRRLIVLLMVAFAVIVVLARLNLFDSVGMTFLASAGVLTVVFGIAGQAVLGNILASLQIAFAKPVRIGDSVMFEGDWAYVESIFYTFLRLRTWDHRRIVVPVTYFVSKPFENWSVAEARMMRVIELRLDHRADVGVLRAQFDKLVRDDPDITDVDATLTYATGQNADGIEISFYAMMPDPSTGWGAQSRLREQLMVHIRDHHPAWLPRARMQEVDAPDDGGRATRFGGTG